MARSAPRLLVLFAALLLAIGAILHAAAFNKISSAVANSNLPAFAGNSLKVLWLADSATSIVLALIFGLIAARPTSATRSVILLLALIPAATAGCIYGFIGSFIGAHVLLAAALAAIAGGVQYSEANTASTRRTRH
jgi:hypothetical protein